MPNPKPLAEAELPEVPSGCEKYNAPVWPTFEQHWFLSVDLNENTIDFGPNDAAKLREVAGWLDRANGLEQQKSEVEVIGDAAIEHGRLCAELVDALGTQSKRRSVSESDITELNNAANAARDKLYALVDKAVKKHA